MAPSTQSRALETRARLLRAGRDAFAYRGCDAVNLTSDILEPAGVSVGSFYHQFADKTELLIAVLDEAADEHQEFTGRQQPGHDPGDLLEADLAEAMEQFFTDLDDRGPLWWIQVRERNNPDPRIQQRILDGRRACRRRITQVIAPHNRCGDKRLDEAVQLIVVVCAGLISVYHDMLPEVRAARRTALPRQVSEFLCRGVRPLLITPGSKSSPPLT